MAESRREALKRREAQDAQALDLRLAGANYRQIGEFLGCSRSVAHDRVMRQLSRTASTEDVEQYREMELERLNALQAAHWPRALGRPARPGQPEIPPDVDSGMMVLRIQMQRSRLLGLNREPVVDFERELRRAALEAGEDPEEVLAEARALQRQLEQGKGRTRRLQLVSGE